MLVGIYISFFHHISFQAYDSALQGVV